MSPKGLSLGNLSLCPAELIVLQGETLCNLDCEYCCLPTRRERHTMSHDNLRAIFENLHFDGLVSPNAAICWHLGEPLLLPIDYYSRAHALIRAMFPFDVRFQFQTNGTHLTDEWCRFFQDEQAHVGISLDGNAFLHDARRVDWKGGASFEKVLGGLSLLQRHEIDYHVIAVLTDQALAAPNQFYEFFHKLGVRRLCLNVVESEGKGIPQFLANPKVFVEIENFYAAIWRLAVKDPDPIWIREIEHAQEGILVGPANRARSQEMDAGKILTVLWNGDVLLYTPGFATVRKIDLPSFVVGNLAKSPLSGYHDVAVVEFLFNSTEKLLNSCEAMCEYYSVCGGGSPAHRWAERRNFDLHTTETCRASVQAKMRGVVRTMLNVISPKAMATTEWRS